MARLEASARASICWRAARWPAIASAIVRSAAIGAPPAVATATATALGPGGDERGMATVAIQVCVKRVRDSALAGNIRIQSKTQGITRVEA